MLNPAKIDKYSCVINIEGKAYIIWGDEYQGRTLGGLKQNLAGHHAALSES